jgi:hypothetical protein
MWSQNTNNRMMNTHRFDQTLNNKGSCLNPLKVEHEIYGQKGNVKIITLRQLSIT